KSERKVNLRNYIIDPSLLEPFTSICIQVIVRSQPPKCIRPFRRIPFVPPNPKETNPKFHLRVDRLNSLINPLNQVIHIRPTPLRLVGIASAIFSKGSVVV